MKKKRRIFQTPEERDAWRAKGERIQQDLRAHMARIEAELAATKRKTA